VGDRWMERWAAGAGLVLLLAMPAPAASQEAQPSAQVLFQSDGSSPWVRVTFGPPGAREGFLCEAPCSVLLVPGDYRFSLQVPPAGAMPVHRTFRVEDGAQFRAGFRSLRMARRAGAAILALGVVVGLTALIAGAMLTDVDCSASTGFCWGIHATYWQPTLLIGGTVFLATGFALGVPLVLQQDRAWLEPVR
jgi:hypothetical protein